MSKLTVKQQAFVDAYCGPSKGNATDAARRAGYKGSERSLISIGAENLTKLYIAEAIASRVEQVASSRIATIEEVQQFLTDIIRDDGEDTPHRLIAAKELGKMQGAYIERKEVTVSAQVSNTTKVDVSKLSKETLLELARAKRDV